MSDDLEMKAVEKYFPFDAFPRMGIRGRTGYVFNLQQC